MYFASKEVVGGANVEYGNEAASRQSLCQRITFSGGALGTWRTFVRIQWPV